MQPFDVNTLIKQNPPTVVPAASPRGVTGPTPADTAAFYASPAGVNNPNTPTPNQIAAQSAAAGTSTSGGGGATYSGPTAAQVAAANAAKAQAALDARVQSAIDNGTSTIRATGEGSGQTAATDLTNQGNQIYGQLAQGQNTIDQARKNIGMNQINSIKGLVNTIRQGLHGQAVNLGNTNALDSSAAGAVARAYANFGNIQENSINNDAATKNEDQDVAQKNLGIQHDIGLSNLKAFRDDSVQKITTEAQTALDNLKQYISIIGGDGNKVDVNGIKQQILDNAQAKLAAVDGFIQDKVGGVRAATGDETARAAYEGSNAGVIPSGEGLPFQLDNPQSSSAATLGGADTSLIPLALKPRTQTVV